MEQGREVQAHSVEKYDDLNEYFWSVDFFRLGWLMLISSIHLLLSPLQRKLRITPSQALIVSRDRCVGKVKFFELRFFWHVLRSFDRMWSFYISSLQVQSLELMYSIKFRVCLS